ncbi:MAG: dihydroorotate dehydrogenase electron transfer subunit [candidate division WOR-3 bacterium]
MPTSELAEIKRCECLGQNIYSFWLNTCKIAIQAKPGQFILVKFNNTTDPFLGRPMSIADVRNHQLRIIFRVRGKGTALLKNKKPGEKIQLFGPLGKPVKKIKNKKVILCAGGIGIAPLLYLARKIYQNNKLYLYFGAKTKSELMLLDEFKNMCQKIYQATEDGSSGYHGFITDLLTNVDSINPDVLFVSGPIGMLKTISTIKLKIKCYAFLEERMGCGCGICFSCAVKKKNHGYLRVCTDGPVFDLADIEL